MDAQLRRDGWASEAYFFLPTAEEARILDRLEALAARLGEDTRAITPEEQARCLTRAQVGGLADGTYVQVKWPDGQGPFVYLLRVDRVGRVLVSRDSLYARQPGHRLDVWGVGREAWQIRVWRVG